MQQIETMFFCVIDNKKLQNIYSRHLTQFVRLTNCKTLASIHWEELVSSVGEVRSSTQRWGNAQRDFYNVIFRMGMTQIFGAVISYIL